MLSDAILFASPRTLLSYIEERRRQKGCKDGGEVTTLQQQNMYH
jgi:hypothetical protein